MCRRLIVVLVMVAVMLLLGATPALAASGGGRPGPAARPATASSPGGAPIAVESAAPAPLPPAPEADWTVLVYMDGDNNLERWVTHDIDKELAAVGSSADVQVVVLADRAKGYSTADGDWSGTLAFNVAQGMQATPQNAVADWGERDMGSPQTLVDFLAWAHASYPSRHTALFLWDHGWGWWPGYTMHDVNSNDSLDMDEIRHAMETAGGVDMVGMDTCLGQMIEVEATFRGFADAVAASEDSIGYTGVDYARVLDKLEADPGMGAAALARTTAAAYRSGHDRWTLASSAVALDWRWDRLVRQVDLLAWKLRAGMKKHRRDYLAAYRRVASALYGDPTSVDLYDAAAQLRRSVDSPTLQRTCTDVMRAVHRVVLYEWSTRAEGRLHGIGIYWPDPPAPPDPEADSISWWDFSYYCSQLEFTRLTTWEDFLIDWGG
ncbi:MAG TPA: clostripain-related cysteine peptidase [Thermoleophilia bacterium]|nr:clostripain-related cysteine peptidase [Thermoleophilia bacterium]